MENLRTDLSLPATVDVNTLPWHSSPGGEVQRRMLEREYAESGRTTSIVRYKPNSRFPTHTHHGGEEFLVLEGLFSDDHGDYPTGTYVRNPIGTHHAPFSTSGCLIFVKLCQMDSTQTKPCAIDTSNTPWTPYKSGLQRLSLYRDDKEQVDLLQATQKTRITLTNAEILLLNGQITTQNTSLKAHTWLRIPDKTQTELTLSKNTRLWIKQGHLSNPAHKM